ncbi:hypothetical protein PIB30_075645 [Stylosanthes scabra]|uniref:Uncharacterized protein n=1 Tax=Stylosanthes scabra TaxID=79078 RepID=A0ABU6VPI7_9FABA|nr:hypothetical protein [Stylosanthes scabra]
MIYYEIERRDQYEDFDDRADLDLAVVKTRRYHFDDKLFVHPLNSIRFDPDRPYELLVDSLLALKRKEPSANREPTPRGSGSSRRASLSPQYSPLNPVVRLGSLSSPSKEVSSSQDRRIREAGTGDLSRVGNSFRHPKAFAQRPSDEEQSQSSDGQIKANPVMTCAVFGHLLLGRVSRLPRWL